MSPNVHTFIMNHEKTLEDLFGVIEVDAISMGDVLIVFHEGRSIFVVANIFIGFFLLARGSQFESWVLSVHFCS